MHYLRLCVGTLIFLLISSAAFAQSLQLADSLNRQGLDYYESGNYRQAEFYLHEAFQLYQKQDEPAVWLSPGIDYAEILVDRSKYDQALALFKRLKKVAVSQKNIQAQARIENDLGWAYNVVGKNKTALNHLKNAIPLAKQAKDTLRLGYIYNNIGSIYFSWGNFDTSLKYRKQSLLFKEQTNDLQSIAITLNNMGLTYNELALHDKALEYYSRSLAIKKELGNVDLLATTSSNIGALHKKLGNFDQAIVYYQQSLKYARQAGNPVKTAQTLNNIGILYGTLGQTEQEMAYYRQSLQLKEQYANAASLAVTYSNIAGSYRQNAQPEQALAYYQKTLELRKQAGNPRQITASLLELAQTEKNRTQFLQSEKYLSQAKLIADSTQDLTHQQRAASLQGDLYFAQGKFEDAISNYKKASDYSRSLEESARIGPLKELAYSYHQLNSDSSLYYGQKAIEIIEKLRSQTGPLSQFKSGYFKQHADFYKTIASWTLEYENDAEKAFRLVESAKARALNEELTAAAQHIDESLPEDARLERAQRRADITHLYSRLDKAPDEETQQNLKARIRDKELAYASFENELHQNYDQFKQIPQPEPVNIEQVQQMCDSETAVLEYSITHDTIIIFLITENEITAKQLDISPGDSPLVNRLQDLVSQFRKAITERAPEDSLARLSDPLYNKLITPVQDQLKGFKNLIIVPDSYLAYLPFEALTNSTNYLVSTYNIKYAPSMTGFSLISSPKTSKPVKLLAVGNTAGYSPSGDFPMLPSVEFEIESIASLFRNATKLHDTKITEQIVKERIQENYSYTHIAAHSVIDEQNSFLSGIILGGPTDTKNIRNDGYLRNDEISSLNISSQMVVLSACKSGVGKLISGEGMLGLQRAFFNAGASTVVVSLWDVYDRPTTHFMKSFYTSLVQKNENPGWWSYWQSFIRWTGWDDSVPYGNSSLSMRETKLAMLEHPKYNHPVYWAPFVVIGR